MSFDFLHILYYIQIKTLKYSADGNTFHTHFYMPKNPAPTPKGNGADPKDIARRLLLARQRLHERASCSGEKPLLAARGTHQDLCGECN